MEEIEEEPNETKGTGDGSHMVLWLLVMLGAAFGLFGFFAYFKKSNRSGD